MLHLFLLLILLSCNNTSNPDSLSQYEINGRDDGVSLNRDLIYRVKAPKNWVKINPDSNQSIFDSKKALCEFTIPDTEIKITIHNFPGTKISPTAQVTRWKKQFKMFDPTKTFTTMQSWGGFAGLYFECTGMGENKAVMVMGWAMQLAPEHLSALESSEDKVSQMRSDYTIKVVGTPYELEKRRQEIERFAHSFELIKEIPAS